MNTIKVTLVKSLNGRHKKHIATANSLGLTKIGNVTVQPDNEMTRGAVQKVCHLVTLEEL